LVDQGDGGVPVDGLGVEEVLVAEGNRVLRQRDDRVDVERNLLEIMGGQEHEAAEVVGVLEGLSPASDDRLEPLLDRLLA
jgi:hypothetical protein